VSPVLGVATAVDPKHVLEVAAAEDGAHGSESVGAGSTLFMVAPRKLLQRRASTWITTVVSGGDRFSRQRGGNR
jgi:hypothetical protein